MRSELTIGVLVTNFDTWELALRCVRAHLKLHGDLLSRVVLLDDGSSSPPPLTAVTAEVEGFSLIRNERNIGFAATLNQGVKLVGTDIVLIFDADAIPLTPYFAVLQMEFERRSKLALLGSPTVGSGGEETESFCREPGLATLLLGQALYARARPLFEIFEERICLWMCALAVRRTAFEDLGGFDEQFDLLDVDVDFCMRVNRSSWELACHPSLLTLHEGGGTPMLVSQRLLRFYNNRWKLLRKHRKICSPRLIKTLIAWRLWAELQLFRVFASRWYVDPRVQEDKIAGRRRILQFCMQNYR